MFELVCDAVLDRESVSRSGDKFERVCSLSYKLELELEAHGLKVSTVDIGNASNFDWKTLFMCMEPK